VTNLWAMNPGLVVGLAGVGCFGMGCVVHMATVPTSANTSVERAMEDHKAVREPSSFMRHNTMNPKKN